MNVRRMAKLILFILTIGWLSFCVSTYNYAYVHVPVKVSVTNNKDALLSFECLELKNSDYIPIIKGQEKEVVFTVKNNFNYPITVYAYHVSDNDCNVTLKDDNFILAAGESKDVSLIVIPGEDAVFDIVINVISRSNFGSSKLIKTLHFREGE